jgi:hypothetical protein
LLDFFESCFFWSMRKGRARKPSAKALEGASQAEGSPQEFGQEKATNKKELAVTATELADEGARFPGASQTQSSEKGQPGLKDDGDMLEGETKKARADEGLARPPPLPDPPVPVWRPPVAPPPPSVIGSDSSSSGSDSSSASDSGNEEDSKSEEKTGKVEKKKKKGKRGGSRVSLTLKEMTEVVQTVANYNFYAAPHKGVKQMQVLCVRSLADKGFTWSIQRIRRFIDGVINDYRAQMKGKTTLPTGNPYDWLQGVHESVAKINMAYTAKEQKKRARELKQERKADATKQNEERRQVAKEELQKYGTPEQAASQLHVKPRSKKQLKREAVAEAADVEQAAGGAEAVKGETPDDSSTARKRGRARLDIIVQEQETKRIEAETKQLEAKVKLEKVTVEAAKVAMEEKKLQLEEKRLAIEERKEAAQSQVALQTAQALSSIVAALALLKK